MITLDNNVRYLQLAFNDDLRTARSILPPRVVKDPRIMIEAGTPFIKREGMSGGERAGENVARDRCG